MALNEFWKNVRMAWEDFGLSTVTKAEAGQARDVSLDLWATPGAVAGYDDTDFDFLGAIERRRMRECVNKFRALAAEIRPDQPVTKEQKKNGFDLLEEIVKILDFSKYADPEAFAAGKRIEHVVSGRMPAWVHGLRFESRRDVSGDPALWIWVIADDQALQSQTLRKNTAALRQILQAAVGTEYWPYIRFRSAEEQASLTGGER